MHFPSDVNCWFVTVLGWLEPLLDRIGENKSNVVTPVIDVIEDDSFRYQYGSAKSTSIGGFDWSLQFTWHGIPDVERQRRNNDVAPIRYIAMLPGLQVINYMMLLHCVTGALLSFSQFVSFELYFILYFVNIF